MITEKQAIDAGDWILKHAEEIAQAKSDRVYHEERLRVVRSEVILETEGTVAIREATAFASKEYGEELELYKEAVRKESFLYTKLKAAEARIDLWRSLNAAHRGLK